MIKDPQLSNPFVINSTRTPQQPVVCDWTSISANQTSTTQPDGEDTLLVSGQRQ